MENMSEYDIRQLKLMREVLISFEKQQIPLIELVGSLFFLISVLEVEKEWGEEFFDELGTLESINAGEIINGSRVDDPLEELRDWGSGLTFGHLIELGVRPIGGVRGNVINLKKIITK